MKVVQVPMDDKDHAALKKAAKEDKRTVASYARKVLLEAIKPATK